MFYYELVWTTGNGKKKTYHFDKYFSINKLSESEFSATITACKPQGNYGSKAFRDRMRGQGLYFLDDIQEMASVRIE